MKSIENKYDDLKNEAQEEAPQVEEQLLGNNVSDESDDSAYIIYK